MLTKAQSGIGTTQYSYGAASNLLAGLTLNSTTTQVTTSPSGNIVGVTPSTGNTSAFSFNQAERLAGITVGGNPVANYTYDAFGRRFSKTLPTSQSLFQYGLSRELLEETNGTGGLVTDTIYLNGAPVADVTPNGLYFLHTDRLGTLQAATTTQQAVAWRAAYQPFGLNSGTTGLLAQNIRFPGQYADAETGFYQNGFRDYNPAWGRYLESDPIGLAGGINTFAYVSGNPIGLLDRMGLFDVSTFCGKTGICNPPASPAEVQQELSLLLTPLMFLPIGGPELGAEKVALEICQPAAETAAALEAPAAGTVQAWSGSITAGAVPDGGMTAFRVWGGSGQAGSWLSPIAPESADAARSLLALPPENSAGFISEVNIPGGTQIQFGTAAPAFGQAGGGIQIQLLQRIPLENFGPGIPLQ